MDTPALLLIVQLFIRYGLLCFYKTKKMSVVFQIWLIFGLMHTGVHGSQNATLNNNDNIHKPLFILNGIEDKFILQTNTHGSLIITYKENTGIILLKKQLFTYKSIEQISGLIDLGSIATSNYNSKKIANHLLVPEENLLQDSRNKFKALALKNKLSKQQKSHRTGLTNMQGNNQKRFIYHIHSESLSYSNCEKLCFTIDGKIPGSIEEIMHIKSFLKPNDTFWILTKIIKYDPLQIQLSDYSRNVYPIDPLLTKENCSENFYHLDMHQYKKVNKIMHKYTWFDATFETYHQKLM